MAGKLNFWKPGTTGPGSTLDRATEAEGNVVQSAPSYSSSIQSQRERLPIFKHREKLLYCLEKFGVIIVVGQTGCGKTTQLPQYLLESGWAADGNVIACTQPRRVAATSVAARVASEVGTVLGDEASVGYTIRFEDVSSKERTRIRYMTDGMLFRETLVDPLLSRYSVIMIDEAHERSVYTDLLLGILKKIRRKRPSLRLIVSSATLDATSFLDYFLSGNSADEATIVSLEGRMYPVEITYLENATPDYVKSAAEIAWKINLQAGTGDILIFLTGREEIEGCLDELSELIPTLPKSAPRLQPLALHAGLSTESQLKVFEPAASGTRKIIIATNIAEIRTYNPTTGLASLSMVPTSVASATQRAGRAGPFESLPRTTSPEITRVDLTTPILQLKSLGIDDLMKFEWVSAPPAESVLRALEGLVAAGMVGEDGRLTPVGEQVAECPVEVNIARMLFSSKDFQCGEEILTIAAMTAVQDAFIIPDGGASGALAELERRKFTAEEGLCIANQTLLAYNAFTRYGRSSSWCKSHALSFRALSRAVSIRSQLKKYMQRFGLPTESCEGDAKRLRRCLVSGYWRNGARWMADGTFRSVRGNRILHIHPTSVLFTRKPRTGWVIFHEMEETKKTQIRIITEIEADWLLEYGHQYFDRHTGVKLIKISHSMRLLCRSNLPHFRDSGGMTRKIKARFCTLRAIKLALLSKVSAPADWTRELQQKFKLPHRRRSACSMSTTPEGSLNANLSFAFRIAKAREPFQSDE
ncbi:pre-mRNA splicing factor [Athelia psychrophila]|uniref:RNA helicase n=1 Tax=Athelia psychrophila TaxID=1759441 RepID=A0A166NCI4_9AGAM|nr:pre-mRNA splicing factor [Fibularhizoctonia sp. CBS 109695]